MTFWCSTIRMLGLGFQRIYSEWPVLCNVYIARILRAPESSEGSSKAHLRRLNKRRRRKDIVCLIQFLNYRKLKIEIVFQENSCVYSRKYN
jgi:hypothetical protein